MPMDLQMRYKNFGPRKKINKMNLENIRKEILQHIKPYAAKYGWNENLFIKIKNTSKFKYEEMKVLFPGSYSTLIEMYLEEINEKMTLESKKIDLIRLRTHERIKELVILRLRIMLQEKKLISKTFLYLLLPHNCKLASKNLYKAVDQMWFLAGDNSTDFNFYSKRIILSSIYITVMIHFINNNNIDETIILLNKQLKKVAKIPKIKSKINNVIQVVPQILKLRKSFKFVKQ